MAINWDQSSYPGKGLWDLESSYFELSSIAIQQAWMDPKKLDIDNSYVLTQLILDCYVVDWID